MLYRVLASLAGIFFFILPGTLVEIDLELHLNRCTVDWLINKKIIVFKEECKCRCASHYLHVLPQRRMLQFRQLEKHSSQYRRVQC